MSGVSIDYEIDILFFDKGNATPLIIVIHISLHKVHETHSILLRSEIWK